MPLLPRLAAALLVAFFVASCPEAHAQEPPYLRHMPTSMQVLEKTRSSDPLGTAVRRFATFNRLIQIMGDMQGSRQFHGPIAAGEQALRSDYVRVAGRVQDQFIAGLPGGEQAAMRGQFYRRSRAYEYDGSFRRQMMNTFFDREFQLAYAQAEARSAAAAHVGAERVTDQPAANATIAEQMGARVPPGWRWLLNRTTWVVALGAGIVLAFVLFRSAMKGCLVMLGMLLLACSILPLSCVALVPGALFGHDPANPAMVFFFSAVGITGVVLGVLFMRIGGARFRKK